MNNLLPSKLPRYLRRLAESYSSNPNLPDREILADCKFSIEEGFWNNYHGVHSGHLITIYVRDELLRYDNSILTRMENTILEDLKNISRHEDGEFFKGVTIEPEDNENFEFLVAQSIPKIQKITKTSTFWKPGTIHLFVSHRDKHKKFAQELAIHFESCGVSSFVAHESIEPNKEWQDEIEKALKSMQVMLALITDDFEESTWCQQEIGFAIGSGVPIVSVKLGSKSPPGFIGNIQAVRGYLTDVKETSLTILTAIATASGTPSIIYDNIINHFLNSTSWTDAGERFEMMSKTISKISDSQLEKLIEGFKNNSQIHNCFHIKKEDRFLAFLARVTGKRYFLSGTIIKEETPF